MSETVNSLPSTTGARTAGGVDVRPDPPCPQVCGTVSIETRKALGYQRLRAHPPSSTPAPMGSEHLCLSQREVRSHGLYPPRSWGTSPCPSSSPAVIVPHIATQAPKKPPEANKRRSAHALDGNFWLATPGTRFADGSKNTCPHCSHKSVDPTCCNEAGRYENP